MHYGNIHHTPLRLSALLWLCIGFCCMASSDVKAGMVTEDSLQIELANAVSDTQKARLSYEIGKELFTTKLDSSIKFLRQAVQTLEAVKDTYPPVNYYRRLIAALAYNGVHEEALEVGQSALETGRKEDDAEILSQIYPTMVAVYSFKGDYRGGMELGHEGIAFLESIQDTLNLGVMYLNLGVLAQGMEDDELTLKNYMAAREMSTAVKDTSNLLLAISNLAATYHGMGKYDEALAIQHQSLELAQVATDSNEWIYPLVNLGGNYLQRERMEKAYGYYDLALQIARKQNIPGQAMVAVLGMSEYKLAVGDLEEAEELLLEALELGHKSGNPGMIEYVYESMVQTAAEMGQFELALDWQTKRLALRDSLLNSETMAQLNDLKVKYELEKKERENEVLRVAREGADTRNKLLYTIGGILAILAGIVLLFLVLANRRKERFNKELSGHQSLIEAKNKMLSDQNESLEVLNQEKDALMAIVAHDLKAPLIKAEGLGHLVETEEGITEQGRQALKMMQGTFQSARSLVDEIVLVSQLESGSVEVEMVPVELCGVLEQVLKTFRPVARQKGIGLELELPDEKLKVRSNEPYFKRIMDNLLSNAMKFSQSGTEVKVKAVQLDGQLMVSIQDQGPGIPKAELPKLFQRFNRLSNRPTGGESSTGLGLSIVSQLAKAIDVGIRVESTLGTGTTFFLDFPRNQQT